MNINKRNTNSAFSSNYRIVTWKRAMKWMSSLDHIGQQWKVQEPFIRMIALYVVNEPVKITETTNEQFNVVIIFDGQGKYQDDISIYRKRFT